MITKISKTASPKKNDYDPQKIKQKFKQKNRKRFIMQIFSVDATIFKRNKSLEYLPISNIQGFIKWLIEVHIFAKFHPQMVHRLFPFCPVIQARWNIYGASGVLSQH